jgi:alpha-L-fucosidase
MLRPPSLLLVSLILSCLGAWGAAHQAPTADQFAEERELQEMYPGYRGVESDYLHAGKAALDRWQDWKFGLRLHWGVYSLLPDGYRETVKRGARWKCSWPLNRHDLEWQGAYHQLWRFFVPGNYDPNRWAEMMVRSGFKFFVITTKHHDGFSLYNTKTKVRRRFIYSGPKIGGIEECNLHYSIMENAYGKDLIGPLVEAGRAHGLGIGLYFSHIDW